MNKSTRPARAWDFPLDLDARTHAPLFLQISRAIVGDIRRGRLRPGTRLPGTRTLARTLSVHRNTVLAAYEELSSEGWTESSRASGTFVSLALPDVEPRRFSTRAAQREEVPSRLSFDMRPREAPPFDCGASPPDVLVMSGGIPDLRLAPTADLARAYRRVLRRDALSVLGYSHVGGHPRLRSALATMLSATRGLATGADDVLITRGSQMALNLVGLELIRPGDVVAVEALGYAAAWETFKRCGAKLVPIPVDDGGLDVAALEELVRRTPIKAVYTTPHHHYPTTVTLTAGRRIALLDLAQRMRFAVIEDDYDHEFHYEGRPVLPLASADRAGVVVYIGTLAKILAPGLRLGYVVAPRPLLEQLTIHRYYLDRQGDHAVECAVAELLEEGVLQRHARRARRIYQARRNQLAEALQRTFGDALSFKLPCGGMALWVRVSPGIDVDAWASEALERKVLFYPSKRYSLDGRSVSGMRLGFANLNETELREAVKRMKLALDRIAGGK